MDNKCDDCIWYAVRKNNDDRVCIYDGIKNESKCDQFRKKHDTGISFPVCDEMTKLRSYLDNHDIKWADASDERVCRTKYWYKGVLYSVINGYGTYGGIDGCDPKEVNMCLLECWSVPFGDDPAGWLKADDIIKKMEEWK